MILEDVISSLDAADKAVTLALNFDGGRIADTFFNTVSCSFSWLPLTLLFICIIYKNSNGEKMRLCMILLGLIITITLCDRISSGIIKPLVMRPRPSHDLYISNLLHYVDGYMGGHYGFVSSHATNASGAVIYCCMFVKRKWFTSIATFFAATVCYSRIYLGVHYFGDVICGAALGITIGFTIYILVKNLKLLHIIRIPLSMKKDCMYLRVIYNIPFLYVKYLCVKTHLPESSK